MVAVATCLLARRDRDRTAAPIARRVVTRVARQLLHAVLDRIDDRARRARAPAAQPARTIDDRGT